LSPEYDAVVVGSGPNGLVGAVALAQAGWTVLVLEAADMIGGGTRTEELTLPGFRHDVCSSVHPLAVASPAFRSLGLESEGLQWAHPDLPLAHPLDDEPVALLDRDLSRTAEGLGRDGARWRRLFGPRVRAGDGLVDTLLQPFDLPPHAPVAGARFGAAGVWPATTVARLRLRTDRARAMFAGLAAHSILDLHSLVTAGYGLMLGMLAHEVGWPVAVGGSSAISDALVTRLRRHGGEVVTGQRVTEWSELPPARAVLFDLAPVAFADIAGDRLPARYAAKLRDYRMGTGVFKVDWALDGPVPWRDPDVGRAATVHLGGRLEEVAAAERLVARGSHPDRPFVLFVQASVADASRAPEGKQTGWAYCHVPNGSTVDMTQVIEDQVERFAPGFRDRVLARHVMGPAALEAHNANLIGGDIGGGAADLRQFVARPVLSPRPWVTPLDGAYLCSSSTPPGGGVHGMGGWVAARHALKRAH
jgi:phytoene dehydrogenase-like protein